MQVTGKNTTLMRWLKHRGGAAQHRRWAAKKREPLPAAIVIGADPGTIISAVTPLPDTLSEYQFAGLLRNRKIDLVDCKTIPLAVPAQAEIIIEGHVSLDDYASEEIGMIKIDVEGTEVSVLNGTKKIIEKYSPNFLIEGLTKQELREQIDFFKPYNYIALKIINGN